MWARQEKTKTFNWMSLFDEFAIGSMCGVQVAYVNMLASPQRIFPFPWVEMVTACGLGTGLAVVLELLRPYRFYERKLAVEDTGQVADEITRIIQAGQPLSYWESQSPPYAGVLAVIVPLVLIIAAVFTWAALPWLSVLLAVIALGIISTYGGFRTQVTRDTVTIRMGLLGIKLLQLKMADIAGVEVHAFSPLRDFGGYGIRFNREMQAYYLQGDRGVKITARDGRKYLIGSDRPEHLAAIITSVRA
jgi:membrane protein YdbS with pleckstrin-like domain